MKMRYLLWDSAQIEEERNGGAVQQRVRKDGDLQLEQPESPMKGQAVRIESTRQEECLMQSTAT